MFGERYFATRERLSEVVRGVKQLALETGTGPGILADEEAFLGKLHEPFVILVCGEINAGKSSFLNGLVGKSLCKVNVLPETKTLCEYRYGSRNRNEKASESHLTCFRDFPLLQEFNVIDTPGTGTGWDAHQANVSQLLASVDLVFCILPVGNPWSASTWNFITANSEIMADKMALVLQQKDAREPADIEVMIAHVGELSKHKLGEVPKVFPVSGQQALAAKKEDPRNERLWQESGYPALEDYLSRMVSRSAKRLQNLREVREETTVVLEEMEERMEERRRTLDSDQGFLRDIENEVDYEREQYAERFVESFSGLGEVFANETEAAARFLAERTGIMRSLRSLFSKDETPILIENGFVEALQQAIEGQASHECDRLMETCRAHWATVRPRVEERLEMPPPDFDEESGDFEGARERFSKRLGLAARRAVVAQKIRANLDLEMGLRRARLRRFLVLTLLLCIAAGALGSFQLHLWGVFLLFLAGVIFGCGLIYSHRSARELVIWFQEKTVLSKRQFSIDLASHYADGIRSFFAEYASMFEGIRRHVARLKVRLKPQLEKWNRFYVELKAIDQDL